MSRRAAVDKAATSTGKPSKPGNGKSQRPAKGKSAHNSDDVGEEVAASDSNHEEPTDELFCICKQPYDPRRFMIGCDNCNGWFHARCVNVTVTEAHKLEQFVCPPCRKSVGGPTPEPVRDGSGVAAEDAEAEALEQRLHDEVLERQRAAAAAASPAGISTNNGNAATSGSNRNSSTPSPAQMMHSSIIGHDDNGDDDTPVSMHVRDRAERDRERAERVAERAERERERERAAERAAERADNDYAPQRPKKPVARMQAVRKTGAPLDSVGRRWPGGKKPSKKMKPNPREAAEIQPFADEIPEEKFSESEDDGDVWLTDDTDDENEPDDGIWTRKISDLRTSYATQATVGMSFTSIPSATWHTSERKGSNRTLELEEIAERFDDLGVHQMHALDGLSPEDRDQSLIEYMLKRRTEVEVLIMSLERRKRILGAAWSWALRQSLLNTINTDAIVAPLEANMLLRGADPVRNPVSQLAKSYTEMFTCTGCNGIIPATEFADHVADCATQAVASSIHFRTIDGFKQPQFVTTVCGFPTDFSGGKPSGYCSNVRLKCPSHAMWDVTMKSELHQESYIQQRRLQLLVDEIEVVSRRMREREEDNKNAVSAAATAAAEQISASIRDYAAHLATAAAAREASIIASQEAEKAAAAAYESGIGGVHPSEVQRQQLQQLQQQQQLQQHQLQQQQQPVMMIEQEWARMQHQHHRQIMEIIHKQQHDAIVAQQHQQQQWEAQYGHAAAASGHTAAPVGQPQYVTNGAPPSFYHIHSGPLSHEQHQHLIQQIQRQQMLGGGSTAGVGGATSGGGRTTEEDAYFKRWVQEGKPPTGRRQKLIPLEMGADGKPVNPNAIGYDIDGRMYELVETSDGSTTPSNATSNANATATSSSSLSSQSSGTSSASLPSSTSATTSVTTPATTTSSAGVVPVTAAPSGEDGVSASPHPPAIDDAPPSTSAAQTSVTSATTSAAAPSSSSSSSSIITEGTTDGEAVAPVTTSTDDNDGVADMDQTASESL